MREKIRLLNVRIAGLKKLNMMQKANAAELLFEDVGFVMLEMYERLEKLEAVDLGEELERIKHEQ